MKKYKGEKSSQEDIISNLPDPILHLILSGLPTTEEVTRTSILSSRWRHLWASVPSIDLDYSRGLKFSRESRKKKFEEFVCRVLANKSIALDSFRLCCVFYYNMSMMWRWIDAAIRRNVKLLDLRFCHKEDYQYIDLPHFLVACRSLEVLRLSLYSPHHLVLPKVTGFSALRVLKLKSCKLFNDNSVKDFLKSCPLLEDLSLVNCITFDLDLFCISCLKLKNLRIDSRKILYTKHWDNGMEGACKRLQICCPELVSLEFAGFMAWEFIFESLDSLKKVVIHPLDTYKWAGKNLCELFAGFSHVESLSLRMCLIQKVNNLDLLESLPDLKTLELTTANDAVSMNVLIRILSGTPNLESLHLIIQKLMFKRWMFKKNVLTNLEMECDCKFERLKMVHMKGMSAVPHHMGFIEFILESTPVLETMSITPSVNITDESLSILTGVLKFPRASPEAEIVFVQDQV